MKKQKGQSLVEFALVLPLFLILIFGLIYSGMLFHDYTSLSNTARSAAREAAITENDSDYTTIKDHYSGQSTITSMYSQGSFDVTEKTSGGDKYIEVRIHMVRNEPTSYVMQMVMPPTFDIVYYMKKDTSASSSGS